MNRDRTIDSDAERYYGGASEGVPGLRSRRTEDSAAEEELQRAEEREA